MCLAVVHFYDYVKFFFLRALKIFFLLNPHLTSSRLQGSRKKRLILKLLIQAIFHHIYIFSHVSAGYKQVKCLLLTYMVFSFLFFVILLVGGVLAYIFRDQVVNTIQAEMISEIRNYDPSDSDNSVTRAWDTTQVTNKVMI